MPNVLVGFFAPLMLFHLGNAIAVESAAPPDLQKTILKVFPQSPKCGLSTNLKVISSKPAEGATERAGEIRELWQATTCDSHSQVRYLFRLAPADNGQLEVVGFERAR